MNFIEELEWRGMIHDIRPGTKEQLNKEVTTAYIGFDPTADSLHVGSFAQIMLLKRFQLADHKPVALVGGATGMIGDPSGKSEERNLLTEDTLNNNLAGIEKQLRKFLDFDSGAPNAAELVNNYDWMKKFTFLEFIRDIGKHITVNYMMAKESVKKRINQNLEDSQIKKVDVELNMPFKRILKFTKEQFAIWRNKKMKRTKNYENLNKSLDNSSDIKDGMSFTEFSYQLVQGYDFLWLYQHKNCKLQMGGSDQWGNITTGTELIRRKTGGEAFALTIPLVTKSDGGKFGKTEAGNIWLDPERTSPYEFYQFWLNTSDSDAENYIKTFTLLDKEKIDDLIVKHTEAPHLRILQKRLAEETTVMVHSRKDYENAVEASQILFGKGTTESLERLDERTFLSVFDGVPQFPVDRPVFDSGILLTDLLAEKTRIFPSKGELRRTILGGGLSLNKTKIDDPELSLNTSWLLNQKYLLIQKGKKNYFLITVK